MGYSVKKSCWSVVVLLLPILTGCTDPMTPPPGVAPFQWTALAPKTVRPGAMCPVAVVRSDRETFDRSTIFDVDAFSRLPPFRGGIRGGKGLALSTPLDTGTFHLVGHNNLGQESWKQTLTVAEPPRRQMSGQLSGADLIWDSTQVIEVTSEVQIPAGSTLRIGPGTVVLLAHQADLVISGELAIDGLASAAVSFMPLNQGQPWGGIVLSGGETEIYFGLFTGGGGNLNRQYGHSNSQPVIGGDDARLTMYYSAVVDNPGKAFGFQNSEIQLSDCLIEHCDTGGEFAGCVTRIEYCSFLEMPYQTSMENDDDNDALYFNSVNVGADTSYVVGTHFYRGLDDAIDHNGALLVVSDCYIAGFDNEGIAASSSRYVRVENCYIVNCEQGIEAGYGSPYVEVNHCTVYACSNGLRFGDSYNWGCSGTLNVRNSVSVSNSTHNVWNWDVLTGGPKAESIFISYSLVNQAEYDTLTGCVTGGAYPDFMTGVLNSASAGRNAGDDGRDMGRLADWPHRR